MISLEKRYENFKSTIEECGSYLLLEDDDTIKHNLFEEFSIDVISFLHEDTRLHSLLGYINLVAYRLKCNRNDICQEKILDI